MARISTWPPLAELSCFSATADIGSGESRYIHKIWTYDGLGYSERMQRRFHIPVSPSERNLFGDFASSYVEDSEPFSGLTAL